MNCKSKLFLLIIVISFLGYQIFSIVLPLFFIYCQNSWQYYDDALTNLSLGNWMLINILVSILDCLGNLGQLIEACIRKQDSFLFVYITCRGLHFLFEVSWSIVGFIIFYNHYWEDCASSGSFNTIVIIALFYGIALFPFLTILSVRIIIKIINQLRRDRNANHQHIDQNINQSLILTQQLNFFEGLAQRSMQSINVRFDD